MAPTEQQRKAAEQLKADGNVLFQKQKFAAAIEKYTEAITLCPDWAVLYVNRAMCHKRRSDWANVAEDATRALQLDKDLVKGHYLRGLAYGNDQQYALAMQHLQKALEAAREQNDSIKDEIWHQLAEASYSEWSQQAAQRRQQRTQLQEDLQAMLRAKGLPADELPSAWQQLFAAAAYRDSPQEAPSLLTCPLTMEIFRDPVVTPSGRSYERGALMDHLKKVGKFDPITRQPMTESDVIPNLSLRAAVEHFLQEHPWAWGEVK